MKFANSLKIFSSVLLTCFCVCNFSFAEEQAPSDKKYAPVSCGQSYARMIAQADEEIQSTKEEDAFLSAAFSKSYHMKYDEDQTIPERAYPGLFLYWAVCASDRSWLMIKDESVWFIEFSDRAKLGSWFHGYAFILRPNNWWDSNKYYKFQFYNTVTKEAIQVNIDRGPLLGGPYTHSIKNLSADSCHLELNDGTVWRVKSIDRKLMNGWSTGDVVYVGLNNDWFTGRYYYVLIHTKTCTWVRASWE